MGTHIGGRCWRRRLGVSGPCERDRGVGDTGEGAGLESAGGCGLSREDGLDIIDHSRGWDEEVEFSRATW